MLTFTFIRQAKSMGIYITLRLQIPRHSQQHSVLLAPFVLLLAQRYDSRQGCHLHQRQYHCPKGPASPYTGAAEQPLPCTCIAGTYPTRVTSAQCTVRAQHSHGRTSGMRCRCCLGKQFRDKWHMSYLHSRYRYFLCCHCRDRVANVSLCL